MTEYLLQHDPKQCYGCRGCEHICPKSAITMVPDSEGFLYPVLDEALCVHCGRCAAVCPYGKSTPDNQPRKTYAAQHINASILQASSSGGAFSAAADAMLAQGGVVAGCIFDESITAVHVVSGQRDIIEKMRGSKYVQSDTKDVYPQIERLLKEGTPVLFTGTPCQVDGLKQYLNKEYDNLFTADLICHGVPSPELLSQFVAAETKKRGKITALRFRDKARNGWTSSGSIVSVRNGKPKTRTFSKYNSSYYYYYLRNSISRMCCYSCKYSSTMRVADITIGDYWNIGDVVPQLDFHEGFSVILVNTEQGQKLFEMMSSSLHVFETKLASAVAGNGNLIKPSDLPASRKDLYTRIREQGYEAVAGQDCKYRYVVPFLRKHTPRAVKRLLKRIKR